MKPAPTSSPASQGSSPPPLEFVTIASDLLAGGLALWSTIALGQLTIENTGIIGAFGLLLLASVARRRLPELSVLAAGMLIAALLPGWNDTGVPQKVFFFAAARGLGLLLRLTARLTSGAAPTSESERWRIILVMLAAAAIWFPRFSTPTQPNADAMWFASVTGDFIEQLRRGNFPIWAGEGVQNFNGPVHPFRTAPGFLYAAAVLDLLTFRTLPILALLEMLVAIGGLASALGLYLALARGRPEMRWLACAAATLFAAAMSLLATSAGDVYPLMTALPIWSGVLLGLTRTREEAGTRPWLNVGIGLALLFLCHPLVALIAAFVVAGTAVVVGKKYGGWGIAIGASVFVVLVTPQVFALSELGRETSGRWIGSFLIGAHPWLTMILALSPVAAMAVFWMSSRRTKIVERGWIVAWGAAAVGLGLVMFVGDHLDTMSFGQEPWFKRNYALLTRPSYVGDALSDPRLEIRLIQPDTGEVLVGPDKIAQGIERIGFDLLEARVPMGENPADAVLRFAPAFFLGGEERKLVRFDFLGKQPRGRLRLTGAGFSREYPLPGTEAPRAAEGEDMATLTVLLTNPSRRPLVLRAMFAPEPGSDAGVPGEVWARARVTRFAAEHGPIEVLSLSPLRLRVEAPEAALLETFRSFAPGYRISVDGKRVPVLRSTEGLVACALAPGYHIVDVHFRGTPELRAAFWTGLAAWAIAGIYLAWELLRASGWRGLR